MEHAVDVCQWFTLLFHPWYSLGALGLGVALALWGWQQRRMTATRLHATTREVQAASVPLWSQGRAQLGQHLAYARRYERPFAIVVLGVETAVPFAFVLIGAVLRDGMRESDMLTYNAMDDYHVLLLPELTGAQTLQAIQRLRELVYRRTGWRVGAGMAVFPEDGLTMEVLVQSARAAQTRAPATAVSGARDENKAARSRR